MLYSKSNSFIHKLFAYALLLAFGLSSPDTNAAEQTVPLLNPSFEDPTLDSTNSWYGGVNDWGTQPAGFVGTTYAQPTIAASPAPDGNQYCWANTNGLQLFQQIGTMEANTWYTFTVDIFPIGDLSTTRAEVIIEETDTWSAQMAAALYHPTWDTAREDFTMTAGQWTTVSVSFHSSQFANLNGNNMRIRVAGDYLAIDNARVTKDADRTYYIDATNGNDNNDGKSEASAWKTFANPNAILLYPGETVALKRGETWTEQLNLAGKGVDGASIELTAYGTGALPTIDLDQPYDGYCVVIEGPSYWNINNLHTRDAKLGIYLRYIDDYGNQDVVVEDCYFENMYDPAFDAALFNYEVAWSCGVFAGGKIGAGNENLTVLNNLTVRRSQMINCIVGFGTNWFFPGVNYSRMTNVYVEDIVVTNNLAGAVWLNHINGGHTKRVRTYGKPDVTNFSFGTGTTAGFMQHCANYTIDHCEFSECARVPGEADGTGFDFEGDNHNIVFSNNVLANNDGAGVLILSSVAPNTNIQITDCVTYNNSLNPWVGHDADYEFKSAGGAASTGTITNTGIYRSVDDTSGWFSDSWDGFTVTNSRQLYYDDVVTRASTWEFETVGDFEGWHTFNHLSGVSVANGLLSGTSNGNDSYLHTPSMFVDTNIYPKVRVRLSSTSGTAAQIFFVTETDASWDGAKLLTFPVVADGVMRDYVVDMRACADFKGVITGMRLDPTTVSGANISIDYFAAVMEDGVTTAPPPPPSWTNLLNNGFESGFENFVDGGGDCALNTLPEYSYFGNNSIRLRDNSGTASSMYMSAGLDVSSYSNAKINFHFYPRSMETGEDLILEVSNGSGWTILDQYVRGTDFENNSFYEVEEVIPVSNLANPADLRFRLRCDASGNSDYIYVDEVTISAR
ncbi:right-handed parallel beta-helix repeat-containing protein [Pelagicoccus mobilis]|uniref:right-handed parallel beta-helix repeat-containing protein n=1 Tax=Pelagicoccus mobilis TaxID=415221 RepID=UPI001905E26D|nr:right-handed parallel beta-helix repeat-containing protein [Pelagicoccus mobilis]